jgi:hypothetical protein
MSILGAKFSKALASGRRGAIIPEAALYTLLKKRAVASNVGADDIERLLRAQILWAMPVIRSVRESDARDAA